MSENTLLGKPLPRLDARQKVTGAYEYGMDHRIDGALESVVLRSPHPHARITRIDTSRAEAFEGVRAVLTGRDFPGLFMPGTVDDQPLLATDRVRFFGEPVALVAAEDRETAEQGARLIEVDYKLLPVITDPETAMEPGAPLLHEHWETYRAEPSLVRYGNVCCHARLAVGDIEQGFAAADYVFEDEFSTESVHQSHVEPRVATALVGPDGRMAVFTNTQLPYWIRTNVAHVLGVPEEEVRIVATGIGGGFGSKLYPQIEPFVALLARKTGRPVRMVTSLEEELVAGLPRHPFKIWLKTGVNKDGTLVARQAKAILDTGAYAGSGPEIASVAILVLAGPYRTEHVSLDAYAVHTNKMNFGAYRGPGGPQSLFALESHLDAIAEKMGLDPLAFRLQNIVQDGDQAANGQMLQGVGLREAMEKAAAAIEWDRPAGPNRGKGLAIGWWTTTGQKSTSHVRLDSDGRVVVSVGTQEIGTGAIMGGVPQVVAETMGVGLEDVVINVTDTTEGLWDWGSQGSRTIFNVGRAAQFACFELIEKIKDLASRLLEVEPSELLLRNRSVMVKDSPEARVSLSDLAKLDIRGELQALYESVPDAALCMSDRMISCLYPAFHYPSFHCHAAEVEVDPGTGEVTVLRYAAAHDIGFAVNPTLIRGQIHGGVVQGIGMGLMEEIQYQDGYRTNVNWTDYKLPTISDVPDIEAIIVEHGIPGGGPYGLKGLGESPVIEPPAALANAIARAAGVRLFSLPMTPEKVLKAIRAKGSSASEA
jgi:CO/xanthine dehydrogenase Mo-binding subunit